MHWEDDDHEEPAVTAPDDVVDVSFRIDCRDLPLDHAEALSDALCRALPWLSEEPLAGIHLIHSAGSGNGWIRSEEPQDLLYFSRRTRLYLRVPRERVDAATALSGKSIEVLGRQIGLSDVGSRPMSTLTTLFSRFVSLPQAGEDETGFLNAAHALLQDKGILVKKMLSGREHRFGTVAGVALTRSLMVDGLTLEDSFRLQREGLGPGRKLGFGIFLPHKGIGPIAAAEKK
jgi:CRISPR-associated protein Cas6